MSAAASSMQDINMPYFRPLLVCAAILLIVNFLASEVIARGLTVGENIALAGLLLACAAIVHKARARSRHKEIEDMRDSALW